MKVQDILTDESKWWKGSPGRGPDGQMCIVEALAEAYPKHGVWLEHYEKCVARLGLDDVPLSHWNDAPERTFADVRALIEAEDI